MSVQASVKELYKAPSASFIDESHPELAKLRIVVVSDAAPQRNGVGAYYHDLMRYFEPHVAYLETICPKIEGDRWTGGWNFTLPGDATQKFVIPSYFKLKRQIEAAKPDLIIVPTPGVFGIYGARIGKALGVKVVVGFHTWFEKLADLYWGKVQGFFTKGYFEVSNRILFRYGDVVLANSDYMVNVASEIGARRTGVMGTPVAFDFITKPVRAFDPNIRSVLFAGRLAAEKNIQSVIEAAKVMPEIQFSISGDGPERDVIAAAANEIPNLTYLGWQNREQLMDCMDHHDLVVLPSLVESFGTIALEAMARQRLTLVSEDCGITEWPDLAKGLFSYPQEKGLTQALRDVIGMDPALKISKAKAGRQAAKDLNNWSCSLWRDIFTEYS